MLNERGKASEKYVLSLFVMTLMLILPFSAQGEALSASEKITAVKEQIQPPSFPNRTFNIKRYGAAGDGKSDSTAAFKKQSKRLTKQEEGALLFHQELMLPVRFI